MQCVIVVFPDHTHLLFEYYLKGLQNTIPGHHHISCPALVSGSFQYADEHTRYHLKCPWEPVHHCKSHLLCDIFLHSLYHGRFLWECGQLGTIFDEKAWPSPGRRIPAQLFSLVVHLLKYTDKQNILVNVWSNGAHHICVFKIISLNIFYCNILDIHVCNGVGPQVLSTFVNPESANHDCSRWLILRHLS